MEMKRNKTAEEPKKQDAGARNRVALEEEEEKVKLEGWMTEPIHKVRPVFPKHPHVVYSPCYPFTVINSPSWSVPSIPMPSITHAIH